MDIIHLLDIFGTFFFAISGSLAANDKKLDAFGVTFIAFITAVGGGTTRDLVLDLHPLVWIKDATILVVIASGVLVAMVFKKYIIHLRRTLFLFDSIGIGFFTIMGMKKALLLSHVSPLVAILMGMVSATFGG
ncbi:MAG: trimeric intracellular cation channel family protein, partial [Bacteroidetes bacterium]